MPPWRAGGGLLEIERKEQQAPKEKLGDCFHFIFPPKAHSHEAGPRTQGNAHFTLCPPLGKPARVAGLV
jgi:hypothetical protein